MTDKTQTISLSERMKAYYEDRTRSYLPRRTYSILRLDGKGFHQYTKRIGAAKPYDVNLMSRMDLTAKFLCANIQGAKLGYVQSDEISILLTDFDGIQTQAWFDGNIQKITSVAASMATGFFNSISAGTFGSKPYDNVAKYQSMDVNDWILQADSELAFFDARVFTIPDKVEVYNYFAWRIKDWEANSLQMLARSHYSHAELHGKGHDELHELIHKAGDNWAKQPDEIKRGRVCTTQLGGMWGTYAAPDLHDAKQKEDFKKLLPEHGYAL